VTRNAFISLSVSQRPRAEYTDFRGNSALGNRIISGIFLGPGIKRQAIYEAKYSDEEY